MKPATGAAIGFVLFFVLMELSVRAYTHFFIVYDIEMTRYATELKTESENPRVGHLHIPNKTVHLMGVDVTTNSDGFRDEEYSQTKNQKKRVIILGDSLTMGWGVRREATFEYLLEKRVNEIHPVEFINFGHGNYNTDQEVNLFLQKGLQYHPDKVVLFYFINDAEPTPKKSQWGFLEHSRFVTFAWSRLKALYARISPSATFKEYYSSLYSDEAPGWKQTKESLKALKQTCLEKGIGLQVVLLPEFHFLSDYPFLEEHKKVAGILSENKISFLDLAPKFKSVTDSRSLWVAPDDAHPNGVAHQMISDFSYDFILGGL